MAAAREGGYSTPMALRAENLAARAWTFKSMGDKEPDHEPDEGQNQHQEEEEVDPALSSAREMIRAVGTLTQAWPRFAVVWAVCHARRGPEAGPRRALDDMIMDGSRNGRYGLSAKTTAEFKSRVRTAALESGFADVFLKQVDNLPDDHKQLTRLESFNGDHPVVGSIISALKRAIWSVLQRVPLVARLSSLLLGPSNVSNVADGEGSRTAVWVCLGRLYGHEFGFGPDNFAKYFVSPDEDFKLMPGWNTPAAEARAKFEETGDVVRACNSVSAGGFAQGRASQAKQPHINLDMISMMQVRTCFLDDCVAQFVADHAGPRQSEDDEDEANVIILGAGFDARAHRLGLAATHKVRFVEVDAAGTQAKKLQKLRSVPEKINDRVTYLGCDFTTESWPDVLQAGGILVDLPSMIVWEGVTYYVPPRVISETLEAVAKFSAPAMICFDYPSAQALTVMKDYTASLKEPWLFGADGDTMEGIVTAAGLTVRDHVSAVDCLAEYFPVRDDGSSLGFAATTKFLMAAGNSKY